MALTTLSNVKLYAYQNGDQVTSDDTLLQLTINQLSQAILSYIQRPALFKASYTETRDGIGNQSMTLRNYPVLSVSSVTVAATLSGYGGSQTPSNGSAQSIPQASSFGYSGYTFDVWDGTVADNPAQLTLNGYWFPRGRNNVQIVYSAGYSVQNEAYTVTSSATSSGLQKYTALQPYGAWGQDDGVFYSSGTQLTALPAGNTPSSAGQYVVTNGDYQFDVSDAGQALNINYSYIPADIEQACIQWVIDRYKYRGRVGEKTKSLSGTETASYAISAMPDFVKLLLNPFCKWLPI
jgi:hypothetical protein